MCVCVCAYLCVSTYMSPFRPPVLGFTRYIYI